MKLSETMKFKFTKEEIKYVQKLINHRIIDHNSKWDYLKP